jgi:hypothetical protein
MTDRAKKPRCEFTRWDQADGHMVYVCDRKSEPVEMHDGGIVNVCAYHRSWMVALARVNADG